MPAPGQKIFPAGYLPRSAGRSQKRALQRHQAFDRDGLSRIDRHSVQPRLVVGTAPMSPGNRARFGTNALARLSTRFRVV